MTETIFSGPGEWRCRFEQYDFSRRGKLYLARFDDHGAVNVAMVGTSEATASDPIAAAFEGDGREVKAMLQAIVDEAWAAGIKPKAFDDAVRDSADQRRHLEDMRAIVAKVADVRLP